MSTQPKILPMDAEEIAFLKRRLIHEKKEFYVGCKILFVGAIIISLLVSALSYFASPLLIDMLVVLFYALCITLTTVCIALFFNYRRSIYKYKQDLLNSVKYAESTIITQKKYMAENNSFHFYITSSKKYSIEVTPEHYNYFNVGDEITIEYSPKTELYLGYY